MGRKQRTLQLHRRIAVDSSDLFRDQLDRIPRLRTVGAHFKQFMRNKLAEQKEFICEHGDDPPEIRDWKWPY